jgi:hypothetical protein
MRHLRFTQRCRYKFKSSRTWRRVTGQTGPDVSNARRAFKSQELLIQWHSVAPSAYAGQLVSILSDRLRLFPPQFETWKPKANARDKFPSHSCLTYLSYWRQLCRFRGLRGTAWLRSHPQCCWSVGEWTGSAPDETEVAQSLEAGLWSTPQSLL